MLHWYCTKTTNVSILVCACICVSIKYLCNVDTQQSRQQRRCMSAKRKQYIYEQHSSTDVVFAVWTSVFSCDNVSIIGSALCVCFDLMYSTAWAGTRRKKSLWCFMCVYSVLLVLYLTFLARVFFIAGGFTLLFCSGEILIRFNFIITLFLHFNSYEHWK